jgi:hypothetical protein
MSEPFLVRRPESRDLQWRRLLSFRHSLPSRPKSLLFRAPFASRVTMNQRKLPDTATSINPAPDNAGGIPTTGTILPIAKALNGTVPGVPFFPKRARLAVLSQAFDQATIRTSLGEESAAPPYIKKDKSLPISKSRCKNLLRSKLVI